MTPEVHDLAMRVGEAVQAAAMTAARGNAEALARGGYDKEAAAHHSAAHGVKRIDVAAIVAQVAELAPNVAEQDAFAAAARAALFDCNRRPAGDYVHPITARVRTVWSAAVRWARLNDRSPAPQHKAGEGVAAD